MQSCYLWIYGAMIPKQLAFVPVGKFNAVILQLYRSGRCFVALLKYAVK